MRRPGRVVGSDSRAKRACRTFGEQLVGGVLAFILLALSLIRRVIAPGSGDAVSSLGTNE